MTLVELNSSIIVLIVGFHCLLSSTGLVLFFLAYDAGFSVSEQLNNITVSTTQQSVVSYCSTLSS